MQKNNFLFYLHQSAIIKHQNNVKTLLKIQLIIIITALSL